MEIIFWILVIIASFFFDDHCHHHHCDSGYNNFGWMMIAIPVLIVGAIVLIGLNSVSTEPAPKRVFISDVDGSKDSVVAAKPSPAHKSVAKVASTQKKPHSMTHRELAHHAK